MLENKTQFIAYIGSKPTKIDTVAGTGTIWHGYGDIQEVMHGAAVKLLMHKDVWITESAFNLIGDSSDLSGFAKIQEEQEFNVKNSSLEKIEAKDLAAESVDDGVGLSDANEDPAPTEKLTAIKSAILAMEQGNPEHFSEKTGAPLLEMVRNIAGDSSISVKELNAAWKALSSKAE